MPHASYYTNDIGLIDFEIERMPIDLQYKKELIKAFNSGKGIIGKLSKSGKLLLFTPKKVKIIKDVPPDGITLPNDWTKYAKIINDEKTKKKDLIEFIRQTYNEVLSEKWKDDVDIKSTGEHADKTIAQIKKEMAALKGKKPFDRETYSELLFALRAKQGWKK